MNKAGPIVIIEDDMDDQALINSVFTELNYINEIIFFRDGVKALAYLKLDGVYPFLILSDINLPKLNGFELKKMIYTNDELSKKCIPYLFFSTAVDEKAVYDAYTSSVQGFFVKPVTYLQLNKTLKLIVEYWQECYSPNNFTFHYHQFSKTIQP